ncbi:MAG: hypothetical protein SPH79_03485 [Schaalia hyovaginalis]|uniref:hypothetical protein n=1 Tax=Schaalia hyovaginalis TaxID=29316 RepID=UPI002A90B979|nr:hypothetical protein [Schaalia hyovaginalis]MDY6213537.1 hypothetical protein [Schaalia hyovaginalis]
MAQERMRVEGMMIGRGFDPAAVAAEWCERGNFPQLEWFPPSSQLLGASFALADGAVALYRDEAGVGIGLLDSYVRAASK